MTRLVLERAGYRVVDAANGIEALLAWDKCGAFVDLILTDVVMPEGISGRDLADLVQDKRPEVRVLFTSGYDKDFGGRELALKDGQAFLPKPASPQQILAAVRRSLDQPSG